MSTPVPKLPEVVYRSAIASAKEGVLTIDARHRIVMMNAAAERMFGFSSEQVRGKTLARLMPEAFRRAHPQWVRRYHGQPGAGVPADLHRKVSGVRANGEVFPLEATISSVEVRTRAGPQRYYTALLCDLSQEQGLRERIDAMNLQMRTVFELAPVAIWITDADRIVFANQTCASLFGAAARPVLQGRSIYDLLSPDSHAKVRKAVTRVLSSGHAVPVLSERIVRLDGDTRDVVIAVAALPDHGRTAVQMVITDVSESAQQGRELERSRSDLRKLSANLVNAREDERRRIARELHDELGQRLTALKMELAALATQADAPTRERRIASMVEMVDDTVASVRRIATELRPLMLDDLGLNAAIEWLAQNWAARMGVRVKLHLEPLPEIDDAATIALYRVVQEALTNIARHARAREVRIELRRSADALRLSVQDDGVGFDEGSIYREGSHGLMGIRERAHMLGGELRIGNARHGGGRISVRLPLRLTREPRA